MDTHLEKEPTFDVLVVLGAVMDWDAPRKRWIFPTIVERYAGKLVMGKARALAARELQHIAPKILVTGGGERHPETGHIASRARELARVITEDLGVPKEKVIPIGTSEAAHTAGNVTNVVTYLTEHPEMLTHRKIAIMCPAFQLERARLMFEQNTFFTEQGIGVEWIAAEDVLEQRSPHYSRWRERVYSTPQAEIARKKEAEGIEDFKAGRYKPGA